jgi:glycerol-3-phosphate acyltransferase PlsY
MTIAQQLGVLAVAAYVLGSVPFGLVVGRMKGIDPRKAGSGNIGATNVGRLLGGRYFAVVFTLDLLKGAIPMLIAANRVSGLADRDKPYLLWMLIGAAAIAPVWCWDFSRFTPCRASARLRCLALPSRSAAPSASGQLPRRYLLRRFI